MPTNIVYQFDPTGLLSDNLVPNEIKGPRNGGLYNTIFIVPDAAPFFRTGLIIKNVTTNAVLTEGVDYILTHQFYDACVQTTKDVYGSISFLSQSMSFNVSLTYQTLGGVWTLSINEVLDELYNRAFNPRIAYWEQVVNIPVQFPIINHDHEWDDFLTPIQIAGKLDAIALAIQERNAQQSTFATIQEAIDGVNTTKQMNPALTNLAIATALSSGVTGAITTSFMTAESIVHDLANDLFGDAMFIQGTGLGESFKVKYNSGNFAVSAGLAYVRGVRAYLGSDTNMGPLPGGGAYDLWMVVLLPNGTTHYDASITFAWNGADTALSYNASGRSYYAVKLSKVTSTVSFTDLRVTFGRNSAHPATTGQDRYLINNLAGEPERITVSGELLKIKSDNLLDASDSPGSTMDVTLPKTTGLLKGDYVDCTRFQGHTIRINVFNNTTDTIVLELPDGTFSSADTQMLFNVNTMLRIVWQGTYWGA